jgi:hypothetical protein
MPRVRNTRCMGSAEARSAQIMVVVRVFSTAVACLLALCCTASGRTLSPLATDTAASAGTTTAVSCTHLQLEVTFSCSRGWP